MVFEGLQGCCKVWPQLSETRTGDLRWRHCHCSSSDNGPNDDTCTTVNYQDDNTDKHRPADGTDSDIENMAMGKLHERDALDDGDDRDDSTYAAVGNDIGALDKKPCQYRTCTCQCFCAAAYY